MKRLYRAAHLIEATHLKTLLDSAGIDTFLRNEFLIRVAGEIPFDQCQPEVWIKDLRDEPVAQQILEDFSGRKRNRGPAWTCPNCREWLEGQFTACWNCGAERPL